jgi:uncharacterized protein
MEQQMPPPPSAGSPTPAMPPPPVTPPPVSPYTPPPPPPPLSPSDERTYAMLAHFSVLLNLVTGFLGVIAPLVIYLIYKDRSRYVAYQSMQAFIFQLVWWVGSIVVITVGWTVTGILSAVLIGLLCIPLNFLSLLLPLVPLIYGVVAGIKCNNGEDFKYWLVGDWVRGTLNTP